MEDNHAEILLTTGGAGHTSAAASRSKANRSALNSQKTSYGKSIVSLNSDIELCFIKPSEKELENIKKQQNIDEKKIRKKELIILITTVVIVSILIYYFF